MNYLGLNVQATGPLPHFGRILEIAVAIVTEDFQEFFAQSWTLSLPPALADAYLTMTVRDRYTANGLLTEIQSSGADLSLVEAEMSDLVRGEAGKLVLLGCDVHLAAAFVKHWMPAFHSLIGDDTLVDERPLRILHARAGIADPTANIPVEHRALPDLRRTLAFFQAVDAATSAT